MSSPSDSPAGPKAEADLDKPENHQVEPPAQQTEDPSITKLKDDMEDALVDYHAAVAHMAQLFPPQPSYHVFNQHLRDDAWHGKPLKPEPLFDYSIAAVTEYQWEVVSFADLLVRHLRVYDILRQEKILPVPGSAQGPDFNKFLRYVAEAIALANLSDKDTSKLIRDMGQDMKYWRMDSRIITRQELDEDD
ncbi:hypothetical protein CSAL01_05673 [Colletotrichum salicis]|uniref:Uncharacterized protein n=1 Tax=Colletotrichum salicis TaxID=1209931 RepID=A0A135V1K6_9PEZI|nr:hypothetical protein CSAL01_05673 [Colletotrichum salicis]